MTTQAASSPAPPPGKRPTGLTVLAVISITFALFGLFIGGGGSYGVWMDRDEVMRQADKIEQLGEELAQNPTEHGDPTTNRMLAKAMADQTRNATPESFQLMMTFGVTGGILLLLAGVGFLGQRRLLGRHVATAACVLLMGCAVVAGMKLGLLFFTIPAIGGAYALVLLVLVHTLYRKTLVR